MRLQLLWLGAYRLPLPSEPGDGAELQESSRRGSGSAVSSISMSRNSSESKTSPQSWHSTNSVSSCRETMRTLGCLQAVAIGRGFDGKKVLFKPNCIGILPILKTISDESFYSFVFFIKRKGEFQAGACNSD